MTGWPSGALGERVRRRLRDEHIISTVGADGTRQPNPVWFLWGGGVDRVRGH